MTPEMRIDLTVTVDGLPPLLRLGLAEAAGVQGCLDFLAVSDLTDAHKATLRYLAGDPEEKPNIEPEPEPHPLEGVRVGDHIRCVTEANQATHTGTYTVNFGIPFIACNDCRAEHTMNLTTSLDVTYEPLGQMRMNPDGDEVAVRLADGWWVPTRGEYIGDEVADWPITYDPTKP